MEPLEIIRAVVGIAYVLFLPGFVWSYVFFRKGEIDPVERTALSFGLSVALVPLAVFWMNYLLGIKITLTNVTVLILLITLIAAAILRIRGHST